MSLHQISPLRIALLIAFIPFSKVFAAANENSFTPTSILVPIRSITLESASRDLVSEIYRCPGNSDSTCYVDVADDAALANLTKSASVTEGTYSILYVGTCEEATSYTAKVKGSVSLNGVTNYTTANANPLSTSIGDLDYTTVTYSGCGRRYVIPGGLSVSNGASIQFNVLMAITNIAWANKSTATIPSGCFSNSSASVCMAYPDIVPYVGTDTPSVQTYHINETAQAGTSGGQILLLFDQASNFIGGFARRLFSQTSEIQFASYDTGIAKFETNGNGTYLVSDYGNSNDGSSPALRFPAFELQNHSGTLDAPLVPASYAYSATRQ